METKKRGNIVSILAFLTGIGSAAAFIAHVVIGIRNNPDYSIWADMLRVLRADGAPQRDLLQLLVDVSSILYIAFALFLTVLFFRRDSKVPAVGAILLSLSAAGSMAGSVLFPDAGAGSLLDFNNPVRDAAMIAVGAFAILGILLIDIGCMRSAQSRGFGVFLLIITCMFLFSAGMYITADTIASAYIGLVEKAYFGLLQIIVISLAFYSIMPGTAAVLDAEDTLGKEAEWV